MDRKAIIVLVVCFVLILTWPSLVQRLFPPQPQPPGTTNDVSRVTNSLPVVSAPPSAAPASVTPATPVAPAAAIPLSAPEQLVVLENADARYTFTSHRGGLKLVELLKYPETVRSRIRRGAGTDRPAALNRAPMAALALLGGEAIEGDGIFKLTRTGSASLRAEKELPGGLHLAKEFALGSNFLITARVRLENRSGQALALPAHELVLGTATPMGPHDDTVSTLLGLYAYNGRKAEHISEAWFQNRTLGCFPGTPLTEYQSKPDNFVWGAVHNQFFAMVVMPGEPAPQVAARRIDLPPPTAEELKADPRALAHPYGYQTAFVYPGASLEPGRTIERSFEIYAGPKEYKTLSRLSKNQELVMDFGGFFGFFAKVLLLSMNGLHALFGGVLGYGWIIIIITVIIKLVFWPLTNASTRSMKRMAALQPQMKALQEKYKDDPQKMNQKLMEFMKENKVSPLGGCLPMLLQIPVFIGFFTMLRTAIELRGARFLWNLDLSSPDTLFLLPGLGFPFNLLPLLMGVTMLWQARMTPPAPGMDPVQQKVMKYMPLMFLVFLYNFSAGLTLYWTVQNLLTILQMKVTKAREPEPAAAAKPTAPPASKVPLTSPKKRK
jgi:YidC/Oxa1 family membrane protein insertase